MDWYFRYLDKQEALKGKMEVPQSCKPNTEFKLFNLSIGSHDSDSQLGTTPVVSGGRMLMYWAGSSQTASPLKAEIRRWIDLTNEAQHGGIREVSLESAEEKNSVDRLDPVYSYSRKSVLRA